jgi:hypothetical protein
VFISYNSADSSQVLPLAQALREGWHLASAVLVGTYCDTLYEDCFAEPVSGEWQRMTPYRIDILAGNRRQVIAEEGAVFIRVSEVRPVPASEFHYVPAGVFHETSIPEGQFVATLIIEGERCGPKPLALEEIRHPPRTHQRELFDLEKTALILENLKSRIMDHGIGEVKVLACMSWFGGFAPSIRIREPDIRHSRPGGSSICSGFPLPGVSHLLVLRGQDYLPGRAEVMIVGSFQRYGLVGK